MAQNRKKSTDFHSSGMAFVFTLDALADTTLSYSGFELAPKVHSILCSVAELML